MRSYTDQDRRRDSYVKLTMGGASLGPGTPISASDPDLRNLASTSERILDFEKEALVSVKSDFDEYYSSLKEKKEISSEEESYNSGFTFSKMEMEAANNSRGEKFNGLEDLIKMQDELNGDLENDLRDTEELLGKMPVTLTAFEEESQAEQSNYDLDETISSSEDFDRLEEEAIEQETSRYVSKEHDYEDEVDYSYTKDNTGLLRVPIDEFVQEGYEEAGDLDRFRTPLNYTKTGDMRKLQLANPTRLETNMRDIEHEFDDENTFFFDNILLSDREHDLEGGDGAYDDEIEVKPYSNGSAQEIREKEIPVDDVILLLRDQKARFLNINLDEDFDFERTNEPYVPSDACKHSDEYEEEFQSEMGEFISNGVSSGFGLELEPENTGRSGRSTDRMLMKSVSNPCFDSRRREESSKMSSVSDSMDNTMFPHNHKINKRQIMSISEFQIANFTGRLQQAESRAGEIEESDQTRRKKNSKKSSKKTSRRKKHGLRRKPPTPSSSKTESKNNEEYSQPSIYDYIPMDSKEKFILNNYNNTLDFSEEKLKEAAYELEDCGDLKIEDYESQSSKSSQIMMQQRVYGDYYNDSIPSSMNLERFKSTLHRAVPDLGHKEDRLKRYFLDSRYGPDRHELTKRKLLCATIRDNKGGTGIGYPLDAPQRKNEGKEIKMEIDEIFIDEVDGTDIDVDRLSHRSGSEINELSERNFERVVNSKFHKRPEPINPLRNSLPDIYRPNFDDTITPKKPRKAPSILRYSEDNRIYSSRQQSKQRSSSKKYTSDDDDFLVKVRDMNRSAFHKKDYDELTTKAFSPLNTANHKSLLSRINQAVKDCKRDYRYRVHF